MNKNQPNIDNQLKTLDYWCIAVILIYFFVIVPIMYNIGF